MSDNRKAILYLITQSELGGAQRYVFDLANNLKSEFNITAAFGGQSAGGELAEKLTIGKIPNYNIPHLKRAISPINDLLALLEIIQLIKDIKPNVIHLNSSKISILGSLATLFATFAFHSQHSHYVVYTAHGWVFNEPLPAWLKLFYFWAEKITAILKNKIICVSEFDRQIALEKKIAPANKLITIHNGLAPINFLSRTEARQKIFSLIPPLLAKERAGGEVLVGSIGNLYKTKGFEYFIKAAKIITEQKISAAFVIIGEGEERKKLEALIKQNNLANNFILAGRINEAAKILTAFDIYVCSSVKEGLSYTIIEAMQAGLPIVAANVGGNSELIEDNITGLLAEAGNPESLAQKIIELINDQTLRNKLSKQAKLKAREEFSLEKMVEETKKVYSLK